MTFATVMVSLALNQPNEARLQVAGDLAARFDAGIIGVAAAEFTPPLYFTTGEQAQELVEQGEGALQNRLAELEQQFRSVVGERAASLSWRSGLDFPARYVLAQARAADILVTGSAPPGMSDAFAIASPKDLVMEAGRPLLVVPDNVSWLDLGTVLVAWKETPEARRAVTDALPLLAKASDVVVVEILENSSDYDACEARLDDVVAWLGHHKITASARVEEPGTGRNVAAKLDAVAADLTAGLVVAGAYGHSRFRELVLGGVTEHLVTRTERCVLLSH
ncbi:universal stress protein [Bradyrhizobium sp. 83012]|uniref:Universal stress protein n=1 Tax=Bradyrhizobium aeschynomenes TaxID=2734909 RepID=A0ABX2CGF4_9BRAD|nr:universal stress protein [Bradyrhizobium aeschynomenes]NPU66810.1 universal stress protein [Bradyrhizobium aeschynomenes]